VKLEPGKYHCATTRAELVEYKSGSVMCRIDTDIGLYGQICLVQKDGTLSERGFKNVMDIFGIKEWTWEDWEGDPGKWAGARIEAVVEERQGERGAFLAIRYINPITNDKTHADNTTDVKSLAAKYGAKTRALLGGSLATPKPAPKQESAPGTDQKACEDDLPF